MVDSFPEGLGPRRSAARRILVGAARLGVSVALLALIAWKVGVDNTLERMLGLDLLAAIAAAALIVATFALHARRWQMVLAAFGPRWSFRRTLRETWIGYFFTQLLPSSIGGDGVRALRLYQAGTPAGTALRSVAVERIYGLVACVLLSVAVIPVLAAMAPTAIGTLAAEVTTLAGLGAILVLLRPGLVTRLMPRRIAEEVRQVSALFRAEARPARLLAISLAMQVTVAAAVALLCWGLGVAANPLLVAALFQPVTLISIVPISLAGWGVREGAAVAIFGAAGVPAAEALPVSVAFGALVLLTSLPGWALFAIDPMAKAPQPR